MSAVKASDAHIIALTETKIGKIPPNTPGYQWVNRPRDLRGGGVVILIRDDTARLTKIISDLEDQDQEIKWIEYSSGRNKIYIGVFYGPQEKVSDEEAERQYSQLTSQVNKLLKKGEVVLLGDFNAKLEINTDTVKQKITRNGKQLEKMIKQTSLTPKSLEANIGNWTRVKRKDISERSVIDYVLMSEHIAKSTKYLEIDEVGVHRLKGKAEIDHNTIIVELDLKIRKKVTSETIYNTKNIKKWQEFNHELANRYEVREPENYTEFEKMVKESMEKTLDKITIKKGQYKPKLTPLAKELKQKKRSARKEFEKANPEQKKAKLDKYIASQKQLREELDHMEQIMVEDRINKLIREGGVKSNLFWKIRKQLINKTKCDEKYDAVR